MIEDSGKLVVEEGFPWLTAQLKTYNAAKFQFYCPENIDNIESPSGRIGKGPEDFSSLNNQTAGRATQ